mgnify:CR=1 FL=1
MRTLEYAQPTEQMKLTDVMDLDSAELASRFLLDRDKPWLVCLKQFSKRLKGYWRGILSRVRWPMHRATGGDQ